MTPLKKTFANLSVGKKLAIGFGILVLLTMMTVAIGFRTADRMIASGNSLYDVSKMESTLLSAQVSRERFISKGEKSDGDRLLELIAQLNNQIDSNYESLPNRQHAELNAMRTAAKDYADARNLLIAAQAQRDAARGALVSAGNSTFGSLSTLQKQLFSRLNDTNEMTASNIQQLQSVSGIYQDILNVRYLVRGYVFQQNKESLEIAETALNKAMADLKKLAAAPNSQSDALNNAENFMTAYQSALSSFAKGISATQEAATNMSEQAKLMRTASDRINQDEIANRTEVERQAKTQLFVAMVAALVIAFLAAVIISRQIVVPLKTLLETSRRISDGDLTMDIANDRRDEIGQLQVSFRAMVESLRSLIGHISEGATQMADVASQLSKASDANNHSISQQRIETDQVATAMNEMAMTVQEVAANAAQASGAARDADRQAREGEQKVNQALHEMDELAAQMSLSQESVRHLQDESDKIGSVLDVIKSVAQQTNLLALNAAIEAARAGEAGRGFAVVADEVRALAQRTQRSTEEIETLINGLRQGVENTTAQMDRSHQLTSRALLLSNEAGSALAVITEAASNIQHMNLQIATAAEEQSAVAEEINRSIVSVRNIAEKTEVISGETAQSSAGIKSLSTQLQAQVARFVV